MTFERAPAGEDKQMVPSFGDGPGRVVVDATWGEIQPMDIAPGVRTVGELEVIEHLRAGGTVVDTRRPEHRERARIAGTVGIVHEDIGDRMDELDRGQVTILMCNGPQCTATPHAIRALLERGHPADRLRYYRGGIHDWMTLGLPVEGSVAGSA